ncbi:MAG TPA: hypothetical protein VJL87_01045 [Bdellovibrionota bacterium]|nr:hypothetical protein [Bdellovibrionota bacterium]
MNRVHWLIYLGVISVLIPKAGNTLELLIEPDPEIMEEEKKISKALEEVRLYLSSEESLVGERKKESSQMERSIHVYKHVVPILRGTIHNLNNLLAHYETLTKKLINQAETYSDRWYDLQEPEQITIKELLLHIQKPQSWFTPPSERYRAERIENILLASLPRGNTKQTEAFSHAKALRQEIGKITGRTEILREMKEGLSRDLKKGEEILTSQKRYQDNLRFMIEQQERSLEQAKRYEQQLLQQQER